MVGQLVHCISGEAGAHAHIQNRYLSSSTAKVIGEMFGEVRVISGAMRSSDPSTKGTTPSLSQPEHCRLAPLHQSPRDSEYPETARSSVLRIFAAFEVLAHAHLS